MKKSQLLCNFSPAISLAKTLCVALMIQLSVVASSTNNLQEKQALIGKEQVSFTVAELEKLGISTLYESLNVLQRLSKNQTETKTYHDQNTDAAQILKSFELKDLELIEISENGQTVNYHLSQSISKQGVTATYTFELVDERNKFNKIDPMTTSASKIPVKRSQIGDIIKVINGKELQALGVSSISEALRLISDLSISQASNVSSIFFRGSHSGATKVLYNGIDLKDVSGINGAALINLIPIQDIKQIEIISGSSSTIQGSNALGAVINIISKKNTHSNKIQTKIGPKQHLASIKINHPIGKTNVYAMGTKSYNNQLSAKKDNSEKDAIEKQTLTLGIDSYPVKYGSLSGFISKINENIDLDNFDSDYSKTDNLLSSIQYKTNLTPHTTSFLSFSLTKSKRDYFNQNILGKYYKGDFYQLDFSHVLSLRKQQTLLFGLNYNKEKASYVNPAWTADNFINKTIDQTSLYSQYRFINTILSTQVGYRYEYNKFLKNNQATSYDISFFRKIPYINSLLKVTHKTGLKTPTIYQEINKRINEKLQAEKSKTNELSLEKGFNDNLLLHVSYFDTQLSNKITYDYTDEKYFNIDTSKQSGFNYEFTLKDIAPLSFLRASRTNITARDNSQSTQSLKVPKYKTSISLGLEKEKYHLGLSFINEGQKNDWGDTYIKSFTYVDINYDYLIDNKLTLSINIHNLFDKDYETASGFSEAERSIFLQAAYHF